MKDHIKTQIREYLPLLLVLLLSIPVFAYHHGYVINDSENMLNTSLSIYELQEFSIAAKKNIVTGEIVKEYSKYGLGLPVLLLPFLALNDLLHSIFGDGLINSNIVMAVPNLIIYALMAQLLYLTILELGYNRRSALILSITSIFATFAIPYISILFTEPLQGICLLSSFYLLLRNKREGGCSMVYLSLASLMFSYAIFTKSANLVFVPLFGLYLLATIKGREGTIPYRGYVAYLIPILIFGLLTAYINYYRFGSIMDFGYGGEASLFVNPIGKGLIDLLFNPNKGLFIFAPLALLFPYSFYAFTKRFPAEGLLLSGLFMVNLLLYAAWWAWEGGGCWGPRFLLPLIPLAFITLAEVLERPLTKLTFPILALLGFIYNYAGVVQDFSGYDYLVHMSSDGIEVDTTRPDRDFIKDGDRLIPPYFVISSHIHAFSVSAGNTWLLRAKLHGKKHGYGLGRENTIYLNPPWLKEFPGNYPPLIESLPKEIGLRILCPSPMLLSSIFCSGAKPSAPYLHDAYINQAAKAEMLGWKDEALRLREKSVREAYEKRRRTGQMALNYGY